MLSKIVSNDQKYWAEFRNIYVVWSGPLNGIFLAHARYTGRARLYSVMHGACTFDSDSFTHWYIHFWNQPNFSDYLRPFWPKFEALFEKIFFSPKGPPFGFRVICPLVFGLREGFIFKLESSGVHQTSSFCDLHPHVNAKNPTPKFWFYHPPYWKIRYTWDQI